MQIKKLLLDLQQIIIHILMIQKMDHNQGDFLTIIAAKIPKYLDREKVEINNIPNITNTPEYFTNINEIDVNYTE